VPLSGLSSQVFWTLVCAWCTCVLVHDVQSGRGIRLPGRSAHLLYHRVLRPLGAVLAFVFAFFTLGAGIGLVQLLLSQHTT